MRGKTLRDTALGAGWIPAYAGMTGGAARFPLSRRRFR